MKRRYFYWSPLTNEKETKTDLSSEEISELKKNNQLLKEQVSKLQEIQEAIWEQIGELEEQVKVDLAEIRQERDERPDTTIEAYNLLLTNKKPAGLPNNWKDELALIPELKKKLDTRPDITLDQWRNDYSQRPTVASYNQTQANLTSWTSQFSGQTPQQVQSQIDSLNTQLSQARSDKNYQDALISTLNERLTKAKRDLTNENYVDYFYCDRCFSEF